jgi:hypothetical protein
MAARIRSLRNGLFPVNEASRDDLVLGDVVTVISIDAATTYNWALLFVPEGSVATFSGIPTQVSPGTFTVDKAGPYLIRLLVDSGLPTESQQYVRLRALTTGLGLTLVAAGERRDTTGIIPVDVDIVGWAYEQNANLLALEAAALAGGTPPAPRQFVFRPGGVAAGNVYTNFALLYADLAAAPGLKELVFDDSIVTPITIPAGAYDFTATKWSSGGINTPQFIGAGNHSTLIYFTAGTVITNLYQIEGLTLFNTLPATSPLQYMGGGTVALYVEQSFLITAPACAPLMQVSGGTTLYLWMSNRTQVGGANREVIELVGADNLWIELISDSQIADDALKGGVAAAVTKISLDSSCGFNTAQPLFLGAVAGFSEIDEANLVSLDPLGMTIVTATEVQTAIAQLDAAIAPTRRNQIIPTSDQSVDALSGTLAVGRFAFNPTEWPATAFYFGAVFSVTNALITGTILLWNITDGEQVTFTTLTTSSLAPVKQQSVALTVGGAPGNLKNAEKIYEIRMSVTGFAPIDIVNLGTAYLLMT